MNDALGFHQQLVDQWIRWLEQYRAPAKQPLKSFPFEGASNIVLPLTATDVDQLFAKFVQTIHASETLWTLEPLNERWVNAAKPLQDFLQWLDANRLKMLAVNKRVFLEMVKLGTGLYKHGWLYQQTPTFHYGPDGKAERVLKTVGAPFVDHVRLADFVIPPYAWNIQPDDQGGAPWVGERMRVPVLTLTQWAQSTAQFLPTISKDDLNAILHFEEASETVYDSARQSADYEKTASGAGIDFETNRPPAHVSGGQPAPSRRKRDIELWEIHARYPTDSARGVDDIIVWYHRPTRRLVRAVYQYYFHGKRPYEAIKYFPGDGFYGIGVCEQKEIFQKTASDLLNFTHDNVLLTNSRMIVAQSGQNIAPGEAVYPWKVWITDGPVNEAFGVFPMADIYASLPGIQQAVEFAGEKRTGIGDLQTGQIESLPGRTPATTMLSLLQEGNRRPDLTVKDIREGLSTVGLRVVQLCQQYMGQAMPQDLGGPALLELAVGALGTPEGGFAAEKLTTPMENAELGLGVTLTATTGQSNKEVARQNYLALVQIAGQLSQQFLQYTQVMMQFPGTPMALVAQQAMIGTAELGNRLLEQYDVRNPEKILPLSLDPANAPVLPQPGLVPPGAQPGAGGVPGGAPFDPTMAALAGGVSQGL